MRKNKHPEIPEHFFISRLEKNTVVLENSDFNITLLFDQKACKEQKIHIIRLIINIRHRLSKC